MPSPEALAFASSISQGISLRSIGQEVKVAQFTDGGGTSGTYNMSVKLPQYSFPVGVKVHIKTGYTGDTTAALAVGTTSDTNMISQNTTINVFTAATLGGLVDDTSAYVFQTADTSILLTVTSSSDFTLVKTANAGDMVVTVYYFSTVEAGGNAPGLNL